MLPAKVACPQCRNVLQSARAVPLGKRIMCLKCGTPFTVTDADIHRAEEGQSASALVAADARPEMPPATAAKKPAILVSQPFAPPPLPVPACQPKPTPPPAIPSPVAPIAPLPRAAGHRGLTLAVIAGGALLFVGTGIALAAYCLTGGESKPPIVAENTNPRGEAAQSPAAPGEKDVGGAAAGGIGPLQAVEPAPEKKAAKAKQPKEAAPGAPPAAGPRKTGSDENKPPLPADPPPVKVQPTNRSILPPAEQLRVNAAIDKGVKYLRNSQHANGSWEAGAHSVGYAALPGLTLLECGVPANDARVQKAATFVRKHAGTLTHTYQLSLAVLFLDKLGEAKDRKLIQTLALRLVAGQNSAGGWTYHCPILSASEDRQLLTFLEQNRPQRLSDPLAQGKSGTLSDPLGKKQPGALSDPLTKTAPGTLPEAIPGKVDPKRPGDKTSALGDPVDPKKDPKLGNPVQAGDPAKKPAAQKKPAVLVKTPKVAPKVTRARPDFLPPNLRALPIAQKIPKGKKNVALGGPGRDDNSNTQFAIMALWVARRHDVPMERTLALVEQRFRASQTARGGWGYKYMAPNQTGPMTCVGLLGLAIGQGSDLLAFAAPGKGAVPAAEDPAMRRGLRALGEYLDHPGKRRKATMVSTYFLWSVERVGVGYNLKTIGNKDWYRWGVEILLPTQHNNGSWFSNAYPGSSTQLDTCMALLFLKRANLVQDLTESLQLYLPITDPDASPGSHKR